MKNKKRLLRSTIHVEQQGIGNFLFFPYLKLRNFFLFTLTFSLLFTARVTAQINAVTPNQYHTPAGFSSFQLPTSTDVVERTNYTPLQVIVATTPDPRLYWDDNAGHKDNLLINEGLPAGTILVDDVALATNDTLVFAYVTVRVLLDNGTTQLHLMVYRWDDLANRFLFSNLPSLISTRTTSTDILDGIRVSINNKTYARIVIVWQQDGSILCTAAYVNFINGTLRLYDCAQSVLISRSSNSNYTFSNPDVANVGRQSDAHFVTSAISNTNDLVVAVDHASIMANPPIYYLYQTSKLIRSARIVQPHKYAYFVTFEELDNVARKTYVKLVGGEYGTNFPVLTLNTSLEDNCTGNTKYKYTGMPTISKTIVHYLPDFGYVGCDMEVAWQQVFCNGSDFCNLNAISKRFWYDLRPLVPPGLYTLNNDEYFHINSDLSKNSFFPSLAVDSTCKKYYSFGVMDKITSANGLIGYKNSDCGSPAIRTTATIANAKPTIAISETTTTPEHNNNLTVYPNPATNTLTVNSKTVITKLEVYNNIGTLVKTINSNYQRVVNANVQGLVNGQYMLKVYYSEGEPSIKKISIQH